MNIRASEGQAPPALATSRYSASSVSESVAPVTGQLLAKYTSVPSRPSSGVVAPTLSISLAAAAFSPKRCEPLARDERHENESCHRIGPPPSEGGVQRQAGERGRGQPGAAD